MRPPPALSIIGWSGAGKTTLLTRLVPELSARGLRVGVVKHSSHAHPLHPEGSDTARLAQVGAALVGFATPSGVQLTFPAPSAHLLLLLAPFSGRVDLVLVEGWKDGPLPKVEVWREGLEPPLETARPDVLAVVGAPHRTGGPPRFEPGDVRGLATFLQRCLDEGVLGSGAP
ncbi:molybdopterin-guanine dinucleotide biosynthesis protein B [Melittangium boletus]|uniref:Molybdopterin-guanine dinucleotide biosynthesis protein MobB n=1 Tax=Melittangium boletus DSM 14713 TaxID=1294270 RepID=A0A250ID55_9BACT|nr:molybdopterin-guanine dinucleotide biosynthesis protein B [Melittangium boletus]ATB29695.1 molybdopterin-guanine dinucleotide biosynthesis protein MobB [Melittangium boletus DSM 14713]